MKSIVISTAVVKGTIIKTIIKKGDTNDMVSNYCWAETQDPQLTWSRTGAQGQGQRRPSSSPIPHFFRVSGARAGTHTFSFLFRQASKRTQGQPSEGTGEPYPRPAPLPPNAFSGFFLGKRAQARSAKRRHRAP